ncbi:P-type E1-E2 ATPase [Halanaerobium saccharolyticum]|uniref:P-type E1-E2 ATPase n=1 Tax=Halanaerobium saccharolyticum TaxID=43595 RepID=A0A4R7YT26_9FIRM|nr:hypothetical protein [Halanaerobium saccharolyticum]TDW00943.1 P-type E1-E2 ATPase [Halanaerobium saccharolyticum]TDX52583.1 P-type E1-E2 ATPase [Halanaerobium saccharolyticum]
MIYSHLTTLYLHDLSNRDTLEYTTTVPYGYHSPYLKNENIKVHTVKKELHFYPYVLGLAIPLVVVVSTTLSAKNGLLIRNRTAFENARKIDTVLFDKTDTLTEGKFGVQDIEVFADNYDREKVLKLSCLKYFYGKLLVVFCYSIYQ